MFCVALTGNVATGKSTVADTFKKEGAEVISADKIAKELTLKGNPAYQRIVDHFSEDILADNDQLDRKALRQIIFSQPEEKKWLENLLHPLIRDEIEEQVSQSSAPYVIVEIPLHFDPKDYPYIDRVLLVTSPDHLQIERIMERDNCNKAQAKAMLKNQPDLETRMQIADDVIENSGDLDALQKKVKRLHEKYQVEFI